MWFECKIPLWTHERELKNSLPSLNSSPLKYRRAALPRSLRDGVIAPSISSLEIENSINPRDSYTCENPAGSNCKQKTVNPVKLGSNTAAPYVPSKISGALLTLSQVQLLTNFKFCMLTNPPTLQDLSCVLHLEG